MDGDSHIHTEVSYSHPNRQPSLALRLYSNVHERAKHVLQERSRTQALGGVQIELGAKNAPRFALFVDAKIRKNAVMRGWGIVGHYIGRWITSSVFSIGLGGLSWPVLARQMKSCCQ